MEVGADPRCEIPGRVVGIGKAAGVLASVATEKSQAFQGRELGRAAVFVIVISVQLVGGDAEQKIRGATVAGHAFGAAGQSPRAFFPFHVPFPFDLDIQSVTVDELGVGLLLVPQVGIARPFSVLAGHEARFDPAA